MPYILICQVPYEFDDDDSQDTTHDIGWGKETAEITVTNEEEARKIAKEVLEEEIIIMNKPYRRKLIKFYYQKDLGQP